MDDHVLRKDDVERAAGVTERRLRDKEKEGLFPKRFLIMEGGRAVGWSANEVAAWLTERMASREQPSQPGQRIGEHVKETETAA